MPEPSGRGGPPPPPTIPADEAPGTPGDDGDADEDVYDMLGPLEDQEEALFTALQGLLAQMESSSGREEVEMRAKIEELRAATEAARGQTAAGAPLSPHFPPLFLGCLRVTISDRHFVLKTLGSRS